MARRSGARGERLDAVCVADELRHDDGATEHEDAIENPLTGRAEIEQGRKSPGAGKGGAEYFGADQDGGAEDGDDVEPDDSAAFDHGVFL